MPTSFEFDIVDDGTLDTVVEVTCNRCEHSFELRYNPEPPEDETEKWDRVQDALDMAESDMDESGCPLCDDDDTMVRSLPIFGVPDWIDQDITISDCMAVQQGGCASGAYMPAVTYYTANKVMAEHGDDVLDYIEREYGEIPAPDMQDMSWCGLAVYFLSMAVELWCDSVCNQLER